MNKTKQIEFYKTQLKTARELKAVAEQNYNIAARLESEAKSALEMLGASSGRSRKGGLTEEQKLKLKASLTK